MVKVCLITDYKNRFGSKYTAKPYRSGMDTSLLLEAFHKRGIEPCLVNAAALASNPSMYDGSVFLYTSAEDRKGKYKSFLDDLILALEKRSSVVIPPYYLMRAHNNKVFMEMLKQKWGPETGDHLRSSVYGSFDELKTQGCNLNFPVIVKKPEGYKSRNVWLVKDNKELFTIAKRISRTFNLKDYIFDQLRRVRYTGFIPESHHRGCFLVQEFVPGLKNDYKVLIYGNRYYPLKRENRANDFRASGSGLLSYPETLPEGLLDFCKNVFVYFDVPSVSLDVAFDGKRFFVLEAQFVYFGTYTVEHSRFWFESEGNSWKREEGSSVLEDVYAESIQWYLRKSLIIK